MDSKASTLILAAALLVALLSAGCQNLDEHPVAASGESVAVATEIATPGSVAESYQAVGTVSSKASAVLSSRTMGRVLAVHVREGDRVRAGQLVVEIDARDVMAQASKAAAGRTEAEQSREEVDRSITAAEQSLAADEAQARLAKVTFERFAQLLERRAVSRQEYDEAEARYRVAAARVESAKASVAAIRARRGAVQARIAQAGADVESASVAVSYQRVTAPFAGIVTRRLVEVGTMASPGMPLLTVEDERVYRLEAGVEEAFAGRLTLGAVVPVTVPALGELRLEGRVGEIVPAADPASRSVMVKIDLPAAVGLRSGMYGRAEFARGERSTLTVPKAALVEQGQLVSVFVVENGEAHLRVVTLGKEREGRVEVLSGLSEGDRVVVDGAGGLSDGRRVTAR
jgi:multidrug efflux pump subunit AcrA (membrane-fusion protein)